MDNFTFAKQTMLNFMDLTKSMYESEKSNATTVKNILSRRNAKLEQKKTDLTQKLNNSKAELSQKQSLCEQFHADNQKLHKDIQELQNQYDMQISANKQLDSNNQELHLNIKRLNSEIQHMNNSMLDFETTANRVSCENDQLKQELEKFRKQYLGVQCKTSSNPQLKRKHDDDDDDEDDDCNLSVRSDDENDCRIVQVVNR